jgi:hypothetical protein
MPQLLSHYCVVYCLIHNEQAYDTEGIISNTAVIALYFALTTWRVVKYKCGDTASGTWEYMYV